MKLQEEAPTCERCGNKPRFIGRMLDPKQGGTVRLFICECGELIKMECDSR